MCHDVRARGVVRRGVLCVPEIWHVQVRLYPLVNSVGCGVVRCVSEAHQDVHMGQAPFLKFHNANHCPRGTWNDGPEHMPGSNIAHHHHSQLQVKNVIHKHWTVTPLHCCPRSSCSWISGQFGFVVSDRDGNAYELEQSAVCHHVLLAMDWDTVTGTVTGGEGHDDTGQRRRRMCRQSWVQGCPVGPACAPALLPATVAPIFGVHN